MAKVVESEEDVLALQNDIDTMMEWAKTWEMVFNVSKCKVLLVG